MSRKPRFVLASLTAILVIAAILLYWNSRPVPAAAIADDVAPGQIAARAAEIFSEPSKTSIFGPVVLKMDSPRKVASLAEVHPGEYLIISDGQYLIGQTTLAAGQAEKYGRLTDYHLLPTPTTLYRMRSDGNFDRLKQDSVSILRLTSTSPMQ